VPRRLHGVFILFSLVSLLLASAFAGSALAAPTWLEPKNLSAKGFGAFGPRIGLDADGQAVTSWYGATEATGDTTQVSERARGGEWSAVKDLRVDGTNTPDLAVSADGTAVVAWEFDDVEGSPLGSYIEAGVRTNGIWSVASLPKDDPGNPLQFSYFPRVAADAAGDAIVVWQECYSADKKMCFHNEGEYVIRASVRPAGGNWSSPKLVTTGSSENAKKLAAAVNSFGDIAVAWEDMKGLRAHVSLLRSGQAPIDHTLSTKQSGSPQVAFAADGTAIAVWDEEDTGFWVSASTAAPGSNSWTPSQHLSSSGLDAFQPDLAVAPDGEAVAVWETLSGGRPIQAAIRAGGAWLPAQNLSAEGVEATHPRVAINPLGAAIAAWRETGSSGPIVASATRSAGGWAAAKALSGATDGAVEPAVAIDPEGNAVVTWRAAKVVKTDERIQAVGFDASGPRLDRLTIPATGTPGQSLGFGVAPSDAWSALAGTSWNFGDGTVAGGTNVTHAYGGPGTYQVTVSGTDALGNVTSATGTVVIAAASMPVIPPVEGTTPPPTPKHPKTKKQPKPKQGMAAATSLASVRNGKALLILRCGGGGPCSGFAKLVYGRSSVIGKSKFGIPAGGTRTLRIALGPAALRLLSAADDQELTVSLEGRGLKPRKLVLVL
jgi:hypothetical protein